MNSLDLVMAPRARDDVDAAIGWYEAEHPGLGQRFADELEATYRRILEHPRLYQAVAEGLRRALVRRFPYVVFYTIERTSIVVVAVLHAHRDPEQWQHAQD